MKNMEYLSPDPLPGGVYNVGRAQIMLKFGKETTSEANRVPDEPGTGCGWACSGSSARGWACKFSHEDSVCQGERGTGYHMWGSK